jgi:hypothetical protein
MANTQAMATSFKGELLNAYHNFSATNPARTINTADTFKAALYLSSATLNASTTAYSTTGEVSSSGTNYTAGGITISSWNAPGTSGTTAYTTPTASFVYTSVTLTVAFNCVLVYNSTQGGRAVSVHTFGDQTVTAGTFTLTMPTNDSTQALIRLA